MATYTLPRTPFGALDGPRLQALGSIKNRQNAISIHEDMASPIGKPIGKPTLESKSNKRAYSPDTFDEFDSENIEPHVFASPSKKSKGCDGTPLKSAKPMFSLMTTPAATSPKFDRKALSLSVPTTSNITPIAHSRGSPKHKRIGLLSKGRRASSSPFRRIDPPAFNAAKAAAALPFSIDAALSGTISSYKAPEPEVPSSKPMPKSWFFEIHEDSPEEEAANLMEHSASVLDISSDDDSETKQRKLESEVGKENVPPPDWTGPTPVPRRHASTAVHKGIHSKVKAAQKEEKDKQGYLMQEDRVALSDMVKEDFFPEGLDEQSVEIVAEEKKSSGLSREATFDFVAPSPKEEVIVVDESKCEGIIVHADEAS